MNTYKAIWTGSYPNLCHGVWHLYKNEEDISELIPNELQKNHMNTYGTYRTWYFDENWHEQFRYYQDGLLEYDWIIENLKWLKEIGPIEDYHNIYEAFNEQDWRTDSCGGCI